MVVVALGVFFISISDGGDGGADPTGDIELVEGEQPRREAESQIAASTADIVEADLSRDADEIVFRVATAADIPSEFERSSLEFRFDISENGRNTWIVSATVNVAATAAVVAQGSDYGSSTIDGTMPGSVEVDPGGVTIRLDPTAIEGFPESFDWVLSSTLTAFRDLPGSTRVEDRFPDEGSSSGPGT